MIGLKNMIYAETPWWDKDNTYYNLTPKQIVKIHKYLNKSKKKES